METDVDKKTAFKVKEYGSRSDGWNDGGREDGAVGEEDPKGGELVEY